MDTGETLWMIVDSATGEALRRGEGPRGSGPLFFTTREKLEAYALRHAVPPYSAHAVPAGVLARMKGKPHWVDPE